LRKGYGKIIPLWSVSNFLSNALRYLGIVTLLLSTPYFPFLSSCALSAASNAPRIAFALRQSSPVVPGQPQQSSQGHRQPGYWNGRRGRQKLTNRNNPPRRVHPGIIDPVIQKLGPAVHLAADMLREAARAIVERRAVQVGHAHGRLGQVAHRLLGGAAAAGGARRQDHREEGEGTPKKLRVGRWLVGRLADGVNNKF
jgi:hypothetical protein